MANLFSSGSSLPAASNLMDQKSAGDSFGAGIDLASAAITKKKKTAYDMDAVQRKYNLLEANPVSTSFVMPQLGDK